MRYSLNLGARASGLGRRRARRTVRGRFAAHVPGIVAGVFLLSVAAADAQEAPPPQTGGETIGRIFDALGVRAPVKEPQDFVVRSRPVEPGYSALPQGGTPPADKTRSALESAATELDRAAIAAKGRAARVAVPDAAGGSSRRGH